MKIIYYRDGENLVPGIVTDKGVVNVNKQLALVGEKEFTDAPLTLADIEPLKKIMEAGLQHPELLLQESNSGNRALYSHDPSKIICIGLNYRKHAIESGMAIPTIPIVFTKYSNTLVDYGKDIPLGKEGEQFDYEVELGVVIGKKCKDVSKDDALNYVLGYCTANDLSCRDLQFKTSQWLLGKSLDHFLPLGKYFVTADEVGDPQKLQLSCTLNGLVEAKLKYCRHDIFCCRNN